MRWLGGTSKLQTLLQEKVVKDGVTGVEAARESLLVIAEPVVLDDVARQVVSTLPSASNPPLAQCKSKDVRLPTRKRPDSDAEKGKAASRENTKER